MHRNYILLKDILLGSKYGDDILKEIEQLLNREGFYAEKMSAQFFKGILMIQRNQKADGEKLCLKSIQFFYDFEENHKGKLYRQFLSEQLNHK